MRFVFYYIGLLIFVAGCGSDEPFIYNNTGDLAGNVKTLINNRSKEITNRSGVLVECEGTSFHTITDSNGDWIIHDLPTSTYSIRFSKEGFLPWWNTSYQFIGGGTQRLDYVMLVGGCDFSFTMDTIVLPTETMNGHFYGHTSANAPAKVGLHVDFLAGLSPNLDISDPSTYLIRINSNNSNSGSVDMSVPIQTAQLKRSFYFTKFKPGDTIYVLAVPYLHTSDYYDVATDKHIVSGYGEPSNVISGIFP